MRVSDPSLAHVIIFPNFAATILVNIWLDYQQQLNAKAQLRAAKWTEMDLIFPNAEGVARCHSAVRKALATTLHLAGIDHFRVHDLRHTAASLLIAEKVDIKSVSGLLRHASVKITYDKYGHLYPEQEDRAVEALERAIAI